jgi:hypothetical protein
VVGVNKPLGALHEETVSEDIKEIVEEIACAYTIVSCGPSVRCFPASKGLFRKTVESTRGKQRSDLPSVQRSSKRKSIIMEEIVM